jgi:hypothetical protein
MEMAVELVEVEKKAEQEMAPIMQKAQAFSVTDEASYLAADEIATEIKRRVKEREAELGPGKELATQTWKWHVGIWRKYVEGPLEAVKMLDRKRYSWKKEEERKRAEEAEKARREEQRKADEEKLKLATRLEDAGMKEQAAKVLDAPVAPTTVVAPAPIEKPKGQTQIENWTARIVDPNLVPREFCVPSQAKLNEYARIMKSRAVTPGVVYEDTGKTTRRGL